MPAIEVVDGLPCPTVAIVLAAGGGRRFLASTHKLEAVLADRTVAVHAIDAARRARVGRVVVVTGSVPHIADALMAAHPDQVSTAHHPGWSDGQATSLQVGLRAADALGAEAVVVGLADQPFVQIDAWRAVARSSSPIAVATYDGRRGNPVRLHHTVWPLLPEHGDEGARSLIRLHPELVQPVPCPGSAADIDTLEDLQQWQSNSSTNSP